MSTEWRDRYLQLLELEPAPPSLEWLTRFGKAHLRHVPFSNHSAVLRRHGAGAGAVPALDTDAVLSAWERGAAGGVCFEVCGPVYRLLETLDYKPYTVLGQITFPASHQAVVVELDGVSYMLDLGVGAPLPDPIPLERVSEYHAAGLSYRYRPDMVAKTCVQDRLINGEWTPFCQYDLTPANDADTEAGYQRNHDPTETWVTSTVTLVRYLNGEVLQVRDNGFNRFVAGEKHSVAIESEDQLRRIIAEQIQLPNLPVTEVLSALKTITGKSLW